MKIVIFGLTVSSSWGNGHATLWRSLIKALLRRGHTVTFYEKEVSYYADSRDLFQLGAGGRLQLYSDFNDIREMALSELGQADLAICTSYCPDGRCAADLIFSSGAGIKCFYDLDTPVTLSAFAARASVEYIPLDGLGAFDLVLSYTGGRALRELQTKLGARVTATLYGSVDPELHRPVPAREDLIANLSYLGTFAPDREDKLDRLLVCSANAEPTYTFRVAGSLYPSTRWPSNINVSEHVPPQDHAAFFASCDATLNITRSAMAAYGYCPSGRLFEAAACGAVIISDWWEGLDTFFTPGEEIFIATTSDDVLAVLHQDKRVLHRVSNAARARALEEHTREARIKELESLCARHRVHSIAIVGN